MGILIIRRVAYGKDDTPPERREYRLLDISSPVGTISDWLEFASKRHCDLILIIEKDGSQVIKEVRNEVSEV